MCGYTIYNLYVSIICDSAWTILKINIIVISVTPFPFDIIADQ